MRVTASNPRSQPGRCKTSVSLAWRPYRPEGSRSRAGPQMPRGPASKLGDRIEIHSGRLQAIEVSPVNDILHEGVAPDGEVCRTSSVFGVTRNRMRATQGRCPQSQTTAWAPMDASKLADHTARWPDEGAPPADPPPGLLRGSRRPPWHWRSWRSWLRTRRLRSLSSWASHSGRARSEYRTQRFGWVPSE